MTVDSQLVTATSKALALMAEVLANPKPLTPELVRAWSLVLSQAGIQPHEIEPATARLLATSTYFPTPADFLKAAHPPEDEQVAVDVAWQNVLDCVRRHGGNASLCVTDLGGDGQALWVVSRMRWTRLCEQLDDENRGRLRAEFAGLYKAARQTGSAAQYVAGRCELENGRTGRTLTPALVGRPDWKALPARETTSALPDVLKSLPDVAEVV